MKGAISRVSRRWWFGMAGCAVFLAVMIGYALPALKAQDQPRAVPDLEGVWDGGNAVRLNTDLRRVAAPAALKATTTVSDAK